MAKRQTFKITHEKPLICNDFIREPVILFMVKSHCMLESMLVRRSTRDFTRNQEEIIEYCMCIILFINSPSGCLEFVKAGISLE